MVSITLRPRSTVFYPLDRRLGTPHVRSEFVGEENLFVRPDVRALSWRNVLIVHGAEFVRGQREDWPQCWDTLARFVLTQLAMYLERLERLTFRRLMSTIVDVPHR